METRMTEADRSAEIARARRVKRVNAITALLIGSILAALVLQLGHFGERQFDPLHLAAGFLAGLLYANAFEYILPRFFLHWGAGFLVQRHGLHHDTAGAPEEPSYVNFATSPWQSACLRASPSISSLMKRFTGVFIWAAGCRDGCAPREIITCCTMEASRAAITSFFRFSIGSFSETPGSTIKSAGAERRTSSRPVFLRE